MNKSQSEILLITQEECAEVIQAISKVFRFGINHSYNGVSNQAHLDEEVGDLLCMIQLMIDKKLLNPDAVEYAKKAKLQKLIKWSGIFSAEETPVN
jgi:NTP pyrophosphatase (non-canonical NTP hydrolase)